MGGGGTFLNTHHRTGIHLLSAYIFFYHSQWFPIPPAVLLFVELEILLCDGLSSLSAIPSFGSRLLE